MTLRTWLSLTFSALVLGAACQRRPSEPVAVVSPSTHPFAPRVQELVPPLLGPCPGPCA